jgi:hypothetical protein
MQNQSKQMNMMVLILVQTLSNSNSLIHPVSLYYDMKFDISDRLQVIVFIVRRTAL